MAFTIAFNTFRHPDTFNLDPANPLPLEAARLLWQAMLWAPLWRLGNPAPRPADDLYAALPAFWRARFNIGDLAAFLHRCRTLGLAEQASGGWRFLSPAEPGFLSPLFTAPDIAAPEEPVEPDISGDAEGAGSGYRCFYPRETPLRPLWEMARDVLAAADSWLTVDEILARLPDPDRLDAEEIAARKQTPLPLSVPPTPEILRILAPMERGLKLKKRPPPPTHPFTLPPRCHTLSNSSKCPHHNPARQRALS